MKRTGEPLNDSRNPIRKISLGSPAANKPPKRRIVYRNSLAKATGDCRIYGVLGLYLYQLNENWEPVLIIDNGLSETMQQFLRDCHVILAFNGENKNYNCKSSNLGSGGDYGFGTNNAPGNLFKMQYHIFNSKDGGSRGELIRSLSDGEEVIPHIRRALGIAGERVKGNVIVLHLKRKFYKNRGINSLDSSGADDDYHEEHKLSATLIVAIALAAAEDDSVSKVYINDDGNRELSILIQQKSKRVLSHLKRFGIKPDEASLSKIQAMPKIGTLLNQYKAIGKWGSNNVTHIGGRSGHLEFMMYMGQNVIYCEDVAAEGAMRIGSTLTQLRYKGEHRVQRLVITPTTKGGLSKAVSSNRHSYQYGDGVYQNTREDEWEEDVGKHLYFQGEEDGVEKIPLKLSIHETLAEILKKANINPIRSRGPINS